MWLGGGKWESRWGGRSGGREQDKNRLFSGWTPRSKTTLLLRTNNRVVLWMNEMSTLCFILIIIITAYIYINKNWALLLLLKILKLNHKKNFKPELLQMNAFHKKGTQVSSYNWKHNSTSHQTWPFIPVKHLTKSSFRITWKLTL